MVTNSRLNMIPSPPGGLALDNIMVNSWHGCNADYCSTQDVCCNARLLLGFVNDKRVTLSMNRILSAALGLGLSVQCAAAQGLGGPNQGPNQWVANCNPGPDCIVSATIDGNSLLGTFVILSYSVASATLTVLVDGAGQRASIRVDEWPFISTSIWQRRHMHLGTAPLSRAAGGIPARQVDDGAGLAAGRQHDRASADAAFGFRPAIRKGPAGPARTLSPQGARTGEPAGLFPTGTFTNGLLLAPVQEAIVGLGHLDALVVADGRRRR